MPIDHQEGHAVQEVGEGGEQLLLAAWRVTKRVGDAMGSALPGTEDLRRWELNEVPQEAWKSSLMGDLDTFLLVRCSRSRNPVLRNTFIEKHKNRATITDDCFIDKAHSQPNPHPRMLIFTSPVATRKRRCQLSPR